MIEQIKTQLELAGQSQLASYLLGATIVSESKNNLTIGVRSPQFMEILASRNQSIIDALHKIGKEIVTIEWQLSLLNLPEIESVTEIRETEIRDARKPGFFIVASEFFQDGYAEKLGAYGIAIYVALIFHSDNRNHDCWPSYNTLAMECGMSRRQAMRQIKKLKMMGIISVEHRRVNNRLNQTNIITILI